MAEQLNFSLVFSEFDDIDGPTPKYSIPELDEELAEQIAQKTITYVYSDDGEVTKSLSYLPLPPDKKAIVQEFKWDDDSVRGGELGGSFCLVFEEKDDLIFYKYSKDVEFLFNKNVKELAKLKAKKTEDKKVFAKIESFFNKFTDKLKELSEQETKGEKDTEEFPDLEKTVELDDSFIYKIVVCGDPACGKTSAVLRFTDQAFRRTYIATVGVNMTSKTYTIEGESVKLVFWDLAGQMKFEVFRNQFYKGVQGIVLIYDVTRPQTLKSIPGWFKDIIEHAVDKDNTPSIVCANKIDLVDDRVVSTEDGKKVAKQLGADYFETSALTGENFDEVLKIMTKTLKDLTLGN